VASDRAGADFFGALAVIGGAVGIPFDIYHTFVLEKKYGFSTITWKLWLTDLIKSIIISAVLMGIMLSAFMAFIIYLPKSWWFWAWVFFTAFEILLLWLYPVVIAPLFNKYEPIRDEELKEKIESLLAKVGLKAEGIFQVDEGKRSKHTNAYFTGIGKTKRIVLFDTLLASHSHDEILAVLAHEIGHWKKKHILKQLIFMIAASFAGFYLVFLLVNWPPLYAAFGLQQTPVYAGLLLVSLYFSCLGFFFSPVGAWISRRYEREADAMAHELTGTSEPMINALKRLAKDNLSNLHPHPWYVRFYYSHPPLVERIEYLKTMDKGKTLKTNKERDLIISMEFMDFSSTDKNLKFYSWTRSFWLNMLDSIKISYYKFPNIYASIMGVFTCDQNRRKLTNGDIVDRR